MRRAALVACGLLLVVAGLAVAAPEPDQQQTAVRTDVVAAVGGPANQRLAQVINPAIPGLLTEVQLAIECAPEAVLTIEIRDADGGMPQANNLASQQTPGSAFPSGPAMKPVVFSSPTFLPAEEQFAVALSATGRGCGAFMSPDNVDAYPRGGQFFSQNLPEQWLPVSNDLVFRTFVDRRCRVPDVVGMGRSDVEPTLTRNGCSPGPTRHAYSRRVAAGVVIAQAPAADTLLAFGTRVSVVISRGVPPCIVPRLRGRTLRRARAALTRANCRLGRVTRRPAARRARGRVISQRPAPGRRLRDRGRVNVVIGR
jgi:hypothetical protein